MARGDTRNEYFTVIDKDDTTSIAREDDGRGSSSRRIRGKLGENIHDINFKSIAKVGLAIRQTRMGNEMVGSYTNNKLRQRKVNQALTFGQYGLGIAYAGVFGVAYAVGDLAYRGIMYSIEADKKNIDARLTRERAGNFTYNGNRFGGRKL